MLALLLETTRGLLYLIELKIYKMLYFIYICIRNN